MNLFKIIGVGTQAWAMAKTIAQDPQVQHVVSKHYPTAVAILELVKPLLAEMVPRQPGPATHTNPVPAPGVYQNPSITAPPSWGTQGPAQPTHGSVDVHTDRMSQVY